MAKPDGWTPRRNGDLYCSPLCGGRCTWAAYQKAKSEARSLCLRLGIGWTPRVWENLGWHFEAISPCGRIRVNPSGRRFHSYLNDRGEAGGRYVGNGTTPKAAVADVVRACKADLAGIGALITGLDYTLKWLPKSRPGQGGRYA